MIEYQKLRSGIVWERLSQLLNDPSARGMPRDMEVQDAATIMADDKEAVQDAEGQRWDGEEVHRSNGFTMITQERKPAFRGFGVSRRFTHPAGDRSLGNVEAEHEKLAMNPGCSPGRILGNHLEYQIPNLYRDPSPATARAANPRQDAPIELKSSSVPLNNGFGKHDDERLLPVGPALPSRNPKQFVEQMESGSGTPTLKHCELLSQR
jgi:hypothetical protein